MNNFFLFAVKSHFRSWEELGTSLVTSRIAEKVLIVPRAKQVPLPLRHIFKFFVKTNLFSETERACLTI